MFCYLSEAEEAYPFQLNIDGTQDFQKQIKTFAEKQERSANLEFGLFLNHRLHKVLFFSVPCVSNCQEITIRR